MKRSALMLVLSAILGSAITSGIFFLTRQERTVKVEHVSALPVHQVALAKNDSATLAPLDFTVVADRVMPAVVHIKSTGTYSAFDSQGGDIPNPFKEFFGDDFLHDFFGPKFKYQNPNGEEGPMMRMGTGSGVIINSQGYIVTNNHVIDQADEIEVTLHDDRKFMATVEGIDPATDLALIKIDANELSTIPLVDSDQAKVGEWVLAVGNPFNLNSTVTAGIISAKGRSINILDDTSAIESFIQTDAAINPGNSGGALVNLQGGLVGINTAIATPTGTYAGYGFAVPSNIVSKVVEDIITYGRVQRGQLGLMIRGIDEKLVREKDLAIHTGVYIDSIFKESAAAVAGIKVGDVIIELDGRKVKNASEVRELIARRKPGDKVEVVVDRFGDRKEFEVTLMNPAGKTTVSKKNNDNKLSSLGADFENVSDRLAKRLNIAGGVRVIELYAGRLRKSGMREGFIITAVDGKSVRSVDEFAKRLENKKGGVMLEGIYEDTPGVFYYAFGI